MCPALSCFPIARVCIRAYQYVSVFICFWSSFLSGAALTHTSLHQTLLVVSQCLLSFVFVDSTSGILLRDPLQRSLEHIARSSLCGFDFCFLPADTYTHIFVFENPIFCPAFPIPRKFVPTQSPADFSADVARHEHEDAASVQPAYDDLCRMISLFTDHAVDIDTAHASSSSAYNAAESSGALPFPFPNDISWHDRLHVALERAQTWRFLLPICRAGFHRSHCEPVCALKSWPVNLS